VYENSLSQGLFFGDRRMGPIYGVQEYWESFYPIQWSEEDPLSALLVHEFSYRHYLQGFV